MSRIGERKVTIGYLGLLYDVRFLYAFVRDELHKTARLYDNVLYWSLYDFCRR